MAKLIHILAASVGSGLVLGASIRLGEAIGASARKRGALNPEKAELGNRLDRLEQKLERNTTATSPEWHSALAGVTARIDRQQAEMQALHHQMSAAMRPQEMAGDPRRDAHRQVSDELDRRLADLEEKFQVRMELANRETVDAMVSSIERRLAPRIDRLETEISDQSAAVAALGDCSLQSERSIQRLLTVMERTLATKVRAGDTERENGNAGGASGAVDGSRQELSKLSVVSGRGQDEPGSSTLRRPVFH